MTITADRTALPLHPLHQVLLAGTLPLLVGVLLADIAYALSYEVQWKNFASWLIVGGLLFSGLALLWAFIDTIRAQQRRQPFIYFLCLLATWICSFVNALVHAMDAWASMPSGLILSALAAALAISATWLGLSTDRTSGVA